MYNTRQVGHRAPRALARLWARALARRNTHSNMWAIVPRDCPTLTEEEQVALADQQARALMSTLRNFFASEPMLQDKRAVFPNLYENAWGDWEDTTSLASRLISDLHAEWTKVGVASAGQQHVLRLVELRVAVHVGQREERVEVQLLFGLVCANKTVTVRK